MEVDILPIIDQVELIYTDYGILIIFLAAAFEITPLGFLIPGGGFAFLGGYFAASGSISLFSVFIAAWFGVWIMFLSAYYIGYKTGSWLVIKLHQEKNEKKAKYLLNKHGGMIITTSLLANFTRFWVSYVAGEQKYKLSRFLLYSGLSSLTWASLMVFSGYFIGGERNLIESQLSKLGILYWLFLIIASGAIYFAIRKEADKLKEIE